MFARLDRKEQTVKKVDKHNPHGKAFRILHVYMRVEIKQNASKRHKAKFRTL